MATQKINRLMTSIVIVFFVLLNINIQGATFTNDDALTYDSNALSTRYAVKIKAIGTGKIGIAFTDGGKICYAEWVYGSGITLLEECSTETGSEVMGLGYYNGQPKIGAMVGAKKIKELSRQSDGSWSSSDTGRVGLTYYPSHSYAVNPVNGYGSFFVETESVVGTSLGDRLHVYYDGDSWEYTVIDEDTTSGAYDAMDFSYDGTPYAFWNNSSTAKKRGGDITPGNLILADAEAEGYQYYINNIHVDEMGVAHIVYCNSSDKLRYRKWTGSAWTATSAADYIVDDTIQIIYGGDVNAGLTVGADGESKFLLYGSGVSSKTKLSSWNTSTSSWDSEEVLSSLAAATLDLTTDKMGNLYGIYKSGRDASNQLHILYENIIPENLITDSSFESPIQLAIDKMPYYFLDKIRVKDDGSPVGAHHGDYLLNFRCWSSNYFNAALTQPFTIDEDTASFSIWVRNRGTGSTGVKFILYGTDGQTEKLDLTSYAYYTGTDNWTKVSSSGIDTSTVNGQSVRLGIKFATPTGGCEMDFDQVGLFAGSRLPTAGVGDNSEYHFVEAEDLPSAAGWEKVAYNAEYSSIKQSGTSALPVLSGYEAYTGAEPAVWELAVKTPGTYNLWCRFMHSYYAGGFTLKVYQDDTLVDSITIDETDSKYGLPWYADVWDSLEVELEPGAVEVHLVRPDAAAASWTARRIDVLVLTNDTTYTPSIQDLITPTYIRYTNNATTGDPYALYMSIRHSTDPWITNVGMISKAGESNSYAVPPTAAASRLAPGESSPWIRITPYLYQYLIDKVHCIATRDSHTTGYVTGDLDGTLEFATGDEHTIISAQTITVDQTNPRFWLTLPGDIARYPSQIISATEYYDLSRDEVDDNMPTPAATAIQYVNVCAPFGLDPVIDDLALYKDEIAMLKDIGFNNLYMNGPELDKAAVDVDLPLDSGTYSYILAKILNSCYLQPDVTGINTMLDDASDDWDTKCANVKSIKIADEMSANDIAHVVSCSTCINVFSAYLQSLGLTKQELNINNWNQAVPKAYADSSTYPLLYYYTHMYRFEAFRSMAKYCSDEVIERFPNALSYNNFSNAVSNGTWVVSDSDVYHSIRNGFPKGWTEDWPGHGAGPMQASFMGAILREACKPESKPFGGYVVITSVPAEEVRTKLYEALSSGAKDLSLYSYGPSYAGLDDWSDELDKYAEIMETLEEFGEVDADLNGTTRRQADIAVLYNRTAGIWESNNSAENSWEMDTQFIYWGLRHAGYNVDIIPEEDIDNGALSNYSVLYINGQWIKDSTATAISSWINSGSNRVLVGTAGAGTYDEANSALSTLNTVFGISANSLTKSNVAGRPLYEVKTLPALTEATVDVQGTDKVFDVLAWKETLTLSTGTDIGQDTQSNVIAAKRTIGTNTAIRYGFLPGLSYIKDGWSATSPHNVTTAIGFSSSINDVIKYGATIGAAKLATTNQSLMELTRYDATGRSVLFLINHAYPTGTTSVTLTIPDCANTASVTSARKGSISFTQSGEDISLTLSMDRNTDILVIKE